MDISTRVDGRLEGRITINGKRKGFYGKTKSEIRNKAKKYLESVENGYKEPKKIIFNEYIEYWLATFKQNKIEPTSYCRLRRVYECQIKDTIGRKYIGDVTTEVIQDLIDKHADGRYKPLAMSGLKRIMNLLSPCLKHAVKDGVISFNPCDDVQLPIESCVKVETKEQFSLTDKELDYFKNGALQKFKTLDEYRSRDSIVLLLILNLGLRVGEMLALTWDDVDFKNKVVHINKILQNNIVNYSGDGKVIYEQLKKGSKTKCGRRVIPMNDNTMHYFLELQKYDNRNHITSEYVCATSASTRNSARNLQRSLDRLIERTPIDRHVTLHTLRHTFGSTLLRRGINIEVVSKLMGHANITITYNKYIHVIQEQKAQAMNMINI